MGGGRAGSGMEVCRKPEKKDREVAFMLGKRLLFLISPRRLCGSLLALGAWVSDLDSPLLGLRITLKWEGRP